MNTNNDQLDNQNELHIRTLQILNLINVELAGLVKDCRVFRKTLIKTAALSKKLFSIPIDISDAGLSQVESVVHRDTIWTKESSSLY